MASTNPFLLITVVLTAAAILAPSTAQQPLYTWCTDSTGNYTTNSTFTSNLSRLLSILSNSYLIDGYSAAISGTAPDRVYGLVLCRGDANETACRRCLELATSDLPDLCPYRKTAIVWYDDCLLRYSNQRVLSAIDAGQIVGMKNSNDVAANETARFNATVRSVLGELALYAAYKATRPPLFAAGEAEFGGDYPKVYGLVQCTRDIAGGDCDRCLQQVIGDYLSWCCSGKIGGRVLAPSCNFRYEVYPFFNYSRKLSLLAAVAPALSPVQAPSPSPLSAAAAPPPLPTSATESTNSTTVGANSEDIKSTGAVLAIAIPLAITGLLFITICCICVYKRKRKATKKKYYNELQDITAIETFHLDLSIIKYATSNFSVSNKLGQGGFGVVYKGLLPDGKEIAVKRLSTSSSQGVEELKNEVALLAKLHHKNLVRLLGVCLDDEEKLLVYEYVANKSLDTILFDSSLKEQLTWERRWKIITGIAKGLLYLHEESQLQIIHRDLKASNVLLDEGMNPKISDFGLARLFDGDHTRTCTSRIVGTFGYMSPEYAMRGQFSNKLDVYSFGVLLLEIMTGQKNSDFFNLESSESSTDLLSYVWENWSNGSIMTSLDPSIRVTCPKSDALRCINIGLMCVQEAPIDRPTMSSVVLMLNSSSVVAHVPRRPAFLSVYGGQESAGDGTTSEGTSNGPTNKLEALSSNGMSVTTMEPR